LLTGSLEYKGNNEFDVKIYYEHILTFTGKMLFDGNTWAMKGGSLLFGFGTKWRGTPVFLLLNQSNTSQVPTLSRFGLVFLCALLLFRTGWVVIVSD